MMYTPNGTFCVEGKASDAKLNFVKAGATA
jgi:hypothetical protein